MQAPLPPLLGTSQLIFHPHLPFPFPCQVLGCCCARGLAMLGVSSSSAALTISADAWANASGLCMPQGPAAAPPSVRPPPDPIAVVSITPWLGVSSRIEQTGRDEQQQGLFLLWGRVPVSGAQFLLGLSLALPFSLCL